MEELFYHIKDYRDNQVKVAELFREGFSNDPLNALRLAFYCLDRKAGLRERESFATMYRIMAGINEDVAQKNLRHIPYYGKYGDLTCLIDSPLKETVKRIVKERLDKDLKEREEGNNVSSVARWLPSLNSSLPKSKYYSALWLEALGVSEDEYCKNLGLLRQCIREGKVKYEDYPTTIGLIKKEDDYSYMIAVLTSERYAVLSL